MNANLLIRMTVAILAIAIGVDLGRRLYETIKNKQAAT